MYNNYKARVRWSTLLACLVIIIASCSNETIEDQLAGKWAMDRVLQHDQNVTAEHNPNKDRWIQFNEDKTFTSGGTPYGDNNGTWYLKHDGKVLYLNSSVEDDDSEWNLVISGDEMQWTGIGDPGKESFTLIHSRVD